MKWAVGGFCGYGGSMWVMGEWAVGYWIVGVISFQKIYGLYGLNIIKWRNGRVRWVLCGFCGCGGSVWVMREWAVGHWIVGIMSFQKIYGLYGLKHHTVDLLSCIVDPDF